MKIKIENFYKIMLTIILCLSFLSYEINLYFSVYSILQFTISFMLILLTIFIFRYESNFKSKILKKSKKNRIIYLLFSLMFIHTSIGCLLYKYCNIMDILKVIILFINTINLFLIIPSLLDIYPNILKYVFKLIIFICFILSLISIFINFKGSFLSYTYRYGRIAAIYSDPNFLGMILGFGLFLIIKGKYNIIIKTIVSLTLVYAIFLTGSRGTFIAIMISLAMDIVIFSKVKYYKKIIFILLYSIIGIILLNYLSDINYFRESQGSNGRKEMIICAIEGFNKSPIIGYGYGSAETYLHSNGYLNASTHNSFIDFLFSYGIIPFAIYITFLLKNIFFNSKSQAQKDFVVIIFFAIINMNTILYNLGGVGISSLLFTLTLGILNNNKLKEEIKT